MVPVFPTKEVDSCGLEKTLPASLQRPPNSSRARAVGLRTRYLLAFTVVLVYLWHLSFSYLPRRAASSLKREFRWADVKPTRSIIWEKCYDDKFDCARLNVPLDWLDPAEEERVVLAVIRLPAIDRSDYRGPIFFNPGGPGGSGTWAVRDHGEYLQKIVGNNHDIISFDPRGIGNSIPRIECWNSPQRRQFWELQEVGVTDANPGALYESFARFSAYSQVCERANFSEILPYVSTASHARDMLEILTQAGEDKLKFWGFSYGTILGGTFAAMYPDKVDRLVSDGNVDYREWYQGDRINFLRDADKVMDAFYELCYQAGPLKCAFYAESPVQVRSRLDSLLERLRVHPAIVPVSEEGPDIPDLVTYSKVKRLISTVLYQPLRRFHLLAQALADLEAGDGKSYHELVSDGDVPSSALCGMQPVPPDVPIDGPPEDTADASPAIRCADGEPFTESVEEFEEYARSLQEISSATGSVNVESRLSCAGRTIRPKWRFTGPFEVNTSFPILYVANMADNVTPLISARNNSLGFKDSVVLVQNSYGHTSLSSPSTCTASYIRAYFQDGTLPVPDTRCEPDSLPFGLPAPPRTWAHDPVLTPAIHALSERASPGVARFLS